MNYPLIKSSWGTEEIESIKSVIESGWFTCGEQVAKLEKEMARMCGSRFAVMSNSGSSANLLSIASYFFTEKSHLQPGDEVIVPAIGWATTYSPLQQYGLKLKIIDVDLGTLNINWEQLKQSVTDKTKMIVAVNILGNPAPLDKIQNLCHERNIIFFEDNCESMGATLNNQWCGSFGQIGTFSTFYSHHISTIEGGFSVTDDEELYKIMLCLRSHGWSRALPESELPHSHYNFLYPGYNLRPTEISGAAGLEQLKKLEGFISERRKNAKIFQELFKNDERFIIQNENGKSSWFSFSIILSPEISLSRDEVMLKLKEKGIEARMVTGGNIVRHPVIRYYNHECPFPLHHADTVHDRGFFIGNHPFSSKKEIHFLYQTLDKVVGSSWRG